MWNFSANIAADKNKVTQLYGNNDAIYKIDDNRNMQKEGNLFLGESRNTIYIWRTGGIAQVIDMDRLKNIDFSGRQVNPGDLYPCLLYTSTRAVGGEAMLLGKEEEVNAVIRRTYPEATRIASDLDEVTDVYKRQSLFSSGVFI